MPRPLVLAHRGASGYAFENSLEAFRLARAMGADGVELDIHATRDGALVVHHDPGLTGLGIIAEHTAAEVAGVRLPNGEPVPLLHEVFDAVGDLRVWVEIKTLPAERDAVLLETLARGPHPARYAVHAFDHRIIARLGARAPTLRRGILSASRAVHPVDELRAAGATVLWQEASLTDRELVGEIHAAAGEVIVWTANTDAELARLAALGVDGLCGNFPDRARAAVGLPARP
jgi:glycerophosphoryl diester phosphodiesterase